MYAGIDLTLDLIYREIINYNGDYYYRRRYVNEEHDIMPTHGRMPTQGHAGTYKPSRGARATRSLEFTCYWRGARGRGAGRTRARRIAGAQRQPFASGACPTILRDYVVAILLTPLATRWYCTGVTAKCQENCEKVYRVGWPPGLDGPEVTPEDVERKLARAFRGDMV